MDKNQSIEVSITAAIQGLLDGLRQGTSAVQTSTGQMQGSLDKLQGSTGGLGGSLGALKGPLMALGGILAGGALIDGLRRAVLHTADLGEALLMASQETGVAVRSLSGLKYAAAQNNVEFGTLTGSLAKLSRNLADAAQNASGGPAQAFRALGVTVQDTNGNLRQADEVIMDLADRFAGMEDGAGKTALAMEVFGRSGAKLIPFLNAGRDGIAELQAEAERLGITMSTEQAAAAEEFGDNLARLQEIGNALMQAFGNELIPILNSLIGTTTEGTNTAGTFATAMKGVGFVVKAVSTTFLTFKAVVETVVNIVVGVVMTLFNVFYSLGKVIAAVVNGDFRGAWEAAKEGAREVANEWKASAEGIKMAWSDMLSSTKAMWDPEEAAPKGSKPKTKAPKPGSGKLPEEDKPEKAPKPQKDPRLDELRRQQEEELALRLQMVGFIRDIGLLQRNQEMDDLEWRRAQGQISGEEYVAQLIALEERKLAIRKAALQEALQEEMLTELERRDLLNEQEMVEQEHQGRLAEIRRTALTEQQQEIQGFLQPLTSAFQDSLQGILAGTMSWSNAMRNIWRGVGQMIDRAIVNMVMAWITGEKTKTVATQAGVMQRLATEAWGAMKSVALAIWTGLKWIAIKGYEAFAGAYSAIASIPYVGPFLAPVMAGAALAAVIGMGSKIASAAGGWEQVPSDQIAQLHKNEMVLPATLAERVRNMTEPGQQGSAGDTYQVTIQALDGRSVERVLRDNQGALVRVMKEAARNGRTN